MDNYAVLVSPAPEFDNLRGGGERFTRGVATAIGLYMPLRFYFLSSNSVKIESIGFDDKVWRGLRLSGGQEVVENNKVSLRQVCDYASRAQALFLHQPFSHVWSLKLIGGLVGPVPLFLTNLGNDPLWPYFTFLINNTRLKITLLEISRTAAQLSRKRFPNARLHVVYGGIDDGGKAPPFLRAPISRRMIYIGRLVPHKGVETIIQAAASLKDWEVSVFTSHYEPTYMEFIKKAAARNQVKVLWHIGYDDSSINAELKKGGVVVCPSRLVDYQGRYHENSELLGLTLLESVARGLPTIASKIPAYEEINECLGGHVPLFVPGDPDGLVLAINQCLENDACENKALLLREKVLQLFTWETYGANVYKIISRSER